MPPMLNAKERKILAEAAAVSATYAYARSKTDTVAEMQSIYDEYAVQAEPTHRAAILLRVIGPQRIDAIQAFAICHALESGEFESLLGGIYLASRLRFLRGWIGGAGNLNHDQGPYDCGQGSYLLHAAAANDADLVARIAARHPAPAQKGPSDKRVLCNLAFALRAGDAARTSDALDEGRAFLETKQPAYVAASTRFAVALLTGDAAEAGVQLHRALGAYPAAQKNHAVFNPAGKLCAVPLLGLYKLARLHARAVFDAIPHPTEPLGFAGVVTYDEAHGFTPVTDFITFRDDLAFLDELLLDPPRFPSS